MRTLERRVAQWKQLEKAKIGPPKLDLTFGLHGCGVDADSAPRVSCLPPPHLGLNGWIQKGGRAGIARRRRGAGNMASRPAACCEPRAPALGDEEEEDEVEEEDEDDSDEEGEEEDEPSMR